MKNCSHYTPSFIERCRVLFVAALLSSPALVSYTLHAQTMLGQDQPGATSADFQMAVRPTGEPDRVKLFVENPQNNSVRIVIRDQKERTYYDRYETRSKMAIPFNFASVLPGAYTFEVSTPKSRQTQTFVIEPPKPRQIQLIPGQQDPDWVVAGKSKKAKTDK